ncbi:MAG: carboxymuconolactone decarboxylase family protein [Acidobacteria bacterium]|nr:carboxymuconolactone decarboxylase family protein [Acidobacteriota bacterium]
MKTPNPGKPRSHQSGAHDTTRETLPDPPRRYRDFVKRYPKLWEAWEKIHEAGSGGPLDQKMCRLLKFAIAIGAMREGAVRSGARKGTAEGVSREELEQVVALAAGTIGLPATVAVYSWLQDCLGVAKVRRRKPGRS